MGIPVYSQRPRNAGGSLLRRCEPSDEPPREEWHWSHCAINCACRCPLHVHTVDGRVDRVEPDPAARACPRGLLMRDWVNSPDRLRWPLRRVGPRGSAQFVRIGWDEALDTVAAELRRIIDRYGNESVLFTYATGQSATTARPFKRLLNCVGGFLDIYNNYSNAQITHMASYMFGPGRTAEDGSDMAVAAQAQMIVAFGTSPMETRQGGAYGTRDWPAAVRAVTQAGGSVVMVDPRRNASVRDGVEWLPIRPGTDAALASALAWQFMADDACDREFLGKYVVGYDEASMPAGWEGGRLSYSDYILGTGYDRIAKTPAWAEAITGIPAEKIVELARRMEGAGPLFVLQGWGPQRRSNGELTSGAVMALPVLLGQVGKPGTNAGMQANGGGNRLSGLPKGTNPVRAAIPCFLFTDAVVRGHLMTARKDGVIGAERLSTDVRCIVNYGGNCLTNQHGDVNRAHRSLSDETKCEFILGMDVEFCDSMRYCDIVLPDLFRLEQDSCLDAGTFDPYVTVGVGHAAPAFERRGAWEVCRDLADRLGVREAFDEGLDELGWMRRLYEKDRLRVPDLPPFEEAAEKGVVHLPPVPQRIALEEYVRDPAANPLNTPSGKIELFSGLLAQRLGEWDLGGDRAVPVPMYVPEWYGVQACGPGHPLQLVGYHYRGRIHSSWGNVERLCRAYPQTAWINPVDAEVRGIEDHDQVLVSNEFGSLVVEAEVTDRVIAGTIAMPQGSWHDADMFGTMVDNGACVNVLTTQRPSPIAKANPQNTIVCQVRKAEPTGMAARVYGESGAGPVCAASIDAGVDKGDDKDPDRGFDKDADKGSDKGVAKGDDASMDKSAAIQALLDASAAFSTAPADGEDLAEYRRLFEGPGRLDPCPWGSVRMGEGVLFGESTGRLLAWMRARGLEPACPDEPADHVAAVLELIAMIAADRPSDLGDLLGEGLCGWVAPYLEELLSATHLEYLASAAGLALSAVRCLSR